MYCVIQEIDVKRPNKNGYPKELKSEYMQMSFQGKDLSHYYYTYSDERFERSIKKAYRISVHQSYRENGKVKKKQMVLCTVNYYDIATDFFSVYEYCDRKINKASKEFGNSIDDIYEIVEEKISPLVDRIQKEFSKTEEYITHQEHEKITTIYAERKIEFASKYGVSKDEYDKCYDVFGELKNQEYLEKIKKEYEQRKEYERKSSSYYEQYYNNYSNNSYSGGGSYYDSLCNNHTNEDKDILKQFYRDLSKKYHPDANPDKDTSKQMKLLNSLKKEWGL